MFHSKRIYVLYSLQTHWICTKQDRPPGTFSLVHRTPEPPPEIPAGVIMITLMRGEEDIPRPQDIHSTCICAGGEGGGTNDF